MHFGKESIDILISGSCYEVNMTDFHWSRYFR